MKIDFLLIRPGSDIGASAIPDLAGPLARGLKARGYSPAILTLSDDVCPSSDIPVLRLRYRERVTAGERWDPAVANAYGVYAFRRFSLCEWGYVQAEVRPRSHELLAAEVPAAFAEVSRLFDEHEIRCVVHPVIGGEIIREASSIVGRARRVPVIYNSTTRYFDNHVLMVRDARRTPFQRPGRLFSDLSEERKRYLRDYLETKRAAKQRTCFWQADRSFWKLATAFVRERKYADFRRLLKGLSRTREHMEMRVSMRYAKPPRSGDRYIYFPLQYTNESTIVNGCPKCFEQEYILSHLSRMLPDDTKLYFKQHPYNPSEASSLGLVRRAASLPGAQLVPVHFSNWDIANGARAVVVIDNTAGYESLLLRKPVVVLGYPAYREWGVTWDVADLNDLGGMLDRAVNAEPLSEERLLDFLASFHSAHLPGNWFDPPLNPEEMASAVIETSRGLPA